MTETEKLYNFFGIIFSIINVEKHLKIFVLLYEKVIINLILSLKNMITSMYNNSITIKPHVICFLKDMLKCLCSEGAVTRGIFRRSAGVKACREFKEKLDSGNYEEPLSGEPVIVTASVFKVDIYKYYFHSNV